VLVDVPFNLTYYHTVGRAVELYGDGYVMGSGSVRTFFKEFGEELISLVEGQDFEFERSLDIRRHHALLFSAA
jgi:hypothetical protein